MAALMAHEQKLGDLISAQARRLHQHLHRARLAVSLQSRQHQQVRFILAGCKIGFILRLGFRRTGWLRPITIRRPLAPNRSGN